MALTTLYSHYDKCFVPLWLIGNWQVAIGNGEGNEKGNVTMAMETGNDHVVMAMLGNGNYKVVRQR